ncbi:MAG: hypothetical protein F6K58_32420, partial [Symploca sp. SIO2E9]|nr:hypothetical protein [Symploca sp. SIO2E9]
PEEPVIPEPDNPVIPEPDNPVIPEPDNPVIPEPDNPVIPEPEEPVIPEPDNPVIPEPDNPVIPEPDNPVIPEPDNPVIPEPDNSSIVLDFETDGSGNSLSPGTVINDQYQNFGITISTPSHPFGAMLFNSNEPTGGDFDLGTPNQAFGGSGKGTGGEANKPGENSRAQNNILIISEDGDSTDPDDNATGGTLRFDWENPVNIDYIEILDADSNQSGSIITYDLEGNELNTYEIPNLGDNGLQRILINNESVARVDVNLVTSGAITEISFTPISATNNSGELFVVTQPNIDDSHTEEKDILTGLINENIQVSANVNNSLNQNEDRKDRGYGFQEEDFLLIPNQQNDLEKTEVSILPNYDTTEIGSSHVSAEENLSQLAPAEKPWNQINSSSSQLLPEPSSEQNFW